MKKTILTLAATAALLCSFQSFAAPTRPQPASGLWWETPYTGRIYQIEVSPTGFVHVLMTVAGNEKAASVRTAQGRLTIDGAASQIQSPLYQFENILPLNGISSNRPTTLPSADGDMTMRFVTPESAVVRIGGVERRIERTQLLTSAESVRSKRLVAQSYLLQIGAATYPDVSLRAVNQARCPTNSAVSASAFALECTSCTPDAQKTLSDYELQIDSSQSELMRMVQVSNACTVSHQLTETHSFIRGLHVAGNAHARFTPNLSEASLKDSFATSSGLWWETPYSGRVYHFEISPEGYVHGLMSLGSQGTIATARSVQGLLFRNGSQAGVVSPLYQLEQVSPLAFAQTSAQTKPSSDGDFALRLNSLERASVILKGREIPIERPQLIVEASDRRANRLVGNYRVQVGNRVYPDARLTPAASACLSVNTNVGVDVLKLECPTCGVPELATLELHIDRTQSERIEIVTIGTERVCSGSFGMQFCNNRQVCTRNSAAEVQGVVYGKTLVNGPALLLAPQ